MRQNKGLERGRESIRIERALSFKKQEDGATAIEYALIASIVGLGIVSGLQMLPPALNALFTSIGPYLNN
ncbi:MAG: Flp family type IVb pilin [Alphaproteobacteria bacterium]|nr:Flp family type IVb pilin [Alphaproteobacteria bacterium]